MGFGAFLLFATNLVGIQFTSSVVLWLFGFNNVLERSGPARGLIVRNASSFGILLGLSMVLSLHTVRTLSNYLFEAKARATLSQAIEALPGADLVDLGFERASDKIVVTAEIKSRQRSAPARWLHWKAGYPNRRGRK